MVNETATSDVVIISMGVRYFSNTSNIFLKKPYANNIRLLLIRIAVILSFAATAFTPTDSATSQIVVPFASGCIVFNSFTGTLYVCAGQIEAGCKIFAPKYAS